MVREGMMKMAQDQDQDKNDQEKGGLEEGPAETHASEDSGIIELSDIAIGIGPEDDTIIELTEEVIDKSLSGITGATRESTDAEEAVLDLSEVEAGATALRSEQEELLADAEDSGTKAPAAASKAGGPDIDDQITEELDTYFGTEEDVTYEEAVPEDITAAGLREDTGGLFELSATRLEEAIDRIIKKRIADRIDKIYAEVLNLSNEIRSLRERLAAGKD